MTFLIPSCPAGKSEWRKCDNGAAVTRMYGSLLKLEIPQRASTSLQNGAELGYAFSPKTVQFPGVTRTGESCSDRKDHFCPETPQERSLLCIITAIGVSNFSEELRDTVDVTEKVTKSDLCRVSAFVVLPVISWGFVCSGWS